VAPTSTKSHFAAPSRAHAPPPQVRPAPDWRDRPITSGTWRWSRIGGASSARFGEGPGGAALEFRCDRGANAVLLIRSGTVGGPTAVTVTTTSTTRTLTGQPLAGPQPALVVALPVRDSLLDAIVFSRGRFAVEARGFAPIYAPTWPEIARVIEDCR
jgi:hypothetical protein